MQFRNRFSEFRPLRTGLIVLVLVGAGRFLIAGEAVLKNGFRLEGSPVAIAGLTTKLISQTRNATDVYPVLMMDNGLQRYFVQRIQVRTLSNAADLSRYETFQLKQPKRGRKRMVGVVGGMKAGPFDKYGRRTVTLQTKRDPLSVIQGITEITPRFLKLEGVTHDWKLSIPTQTVPDVILDPILRYATDQAVPEERMAIARFYLQAGRYPRAFAEVESISRDFPEYKETLDEITLNLRKLFAADLFNEVQRRRDAGQHRLAIGATKKFPTERMSQSVLRDVEKMSDEYADMMDDGRRVRMLLGDLQSRLQDEKLVESVVPMRSIVTQNLDFESLGRLQAFLSLSDDETLSPQEKLALAYSGWVVGTANAVTDLNLTIRLWDARFLVQEYLRSNAEQDRQELLRKLKGEEGIDAATIARIIPLLPPRVETPEAQPGRIHRIELPLKKAVPSAEQGRATEDLPVSVGYSVLLPPEYNPNHLYPVVVTLKPTHRSIEKQIAWWGGSQAAPGLSQRRGYIVLAPEYLPAGSTKYDYAAESHDVVLRTIRDARKRFSIDSDRVFLSGHGSGGDAAFDVGMSHPDLFAGVIPITGISDEYCKWYWENAGNVAWYVVGGEKDRDSMARNSRDLYRMMKNKYDILYVEYIGRGYESYHEEIEKIFEWMDLHRRVKYIKKMDIKVLRPSDNRFYWIEMQGLPTNVTQSTVLKETRVRAVRPMQIEATVTPGNSILINRSAAKRNTLYLSPELVDFQNRVTVKLRGRIRYGDFVSPDIAVMLEDLRLRGDRQKLYWAKLEL